MVTLVSAAAVGPAACLLGHQHWQQRGQLHEPKWTSHTTSDHPDHLAQGIVGARNNVGGVSRVCGQDSSQRGAQVREEAARVVCQPPRHLQAGVTLVTLGA